MPDIVLTLLNFLFSCFTFLLHQFFNSKLQNIISKSCYLISFTKIRVTSCMNTEFEELVFWWVITRYILQLIMFEILLKIELFLAFVLLNIFFFYYKRYFQFYFPFYLGRVSTHLYVQSKRQGMFQINMNCNFMILFILWLGRSVTQKYCTSMDPVWVWSLKKV